MKTRQYNNGDTCTISANPGSHYTFDGWYENNTLVSSDNPYSFTVSSDKTLEGKFTAKSYTITTATSPVSGGSISGGGTYDYGDTCTLTATENTGFTFATWVDENNNFLSNSNPYTFTVSGDLTAKALFSTNYNTYTITVISPHGTISGAGTYELNDTCTLTATPSFGYTFDHWEMNGVEISDDNPYSFTVNGDKTITAVYEALPTCTITVISQHGTVSGDGTYLIGDTVNLSSTPSTGYTFDGWYENGNLVSSNNPYSFTASVDRTIECVYEEAPSLKITTNAPTLFTILGNNPYDYYQWTLNTGLNKYYGDIEGLALNEITGIVIYLNDRQNVVSIDATELTSWTTISNSTFYNCTGLTSITLPNSITSIGNIAFDNCTSLTSITLPDSLTYMGQGAFINCTGLTSITCLATTPPTLGSNVFFNTNNCPIHVPAASLSAYQTAWTDYSSRLQGI